MYSNYTVWLHYEMLCRRTRSREIWCSNMSHSLNLIENPFQHVHVTTLLIKTISTFSYVFGLVTDVRYMISDN